MFPLLHNFTLSITITKSPIHFQRTPTASLPRSSPTTTRHTLKAPSRSGRQTQTFRFSFVWSTTFKVSLVKNTLKHAYETYIILKIKVRSTSLAIKIFRKCAEFLINDAETLQCYLQHNKFTCTATPLIVNRFRSFKRQSFQRSLLNPAKDIDEPEYPFVVP